MYLNWICAALGLLAGAGAVGIAALGGGSPGALQIAAAGALGLAVWLAAVAVIGIFHKRPLVEFVASLRQMHRDGDLAKRVRVGNGLAGEAARAFNELIQSFQGIVGKVIFDAQRVGEAAEQLSLHAGSVAEGSSHQRDAAESMA
ncbi:MAG: methyl-accepting chemotaxis protein, partial [Zoogloea sp.]|nr:methyl-accepting chemotaxis protein [Zoogloea sp.]